MLLMFSIANISHTVCACICPNKPLWQALFRSQSSSNNVFQQEMYFDVQDKNRRLSVFAFFCHVRACSIDSQKRNIQSFIIRCHFLIGFPNQDRSAQVFLQWIFLKRWQHTDYNLHRIHNAMLSHCVSSARFQPCSTYWALLARFLTLWHYLGLLNIWSFIINRPHYCICFCFWNQLLHCPVANVILTFSHACYHKP